MLNYGYWNSLTQLRGQIIAVCQNTTGILVTPWQTTLNCTVDCKILAARLGLWQSTLKFRLLSVAIRSTVERGNVDHFFFFHIILKIDPIIFSQFFLQEKSYEFWYFL
jgi:hypothetical protein